MSGVYPLFILLLRNYHLFLYAAVTHTLWLMSTKVVEAVAPAKPGLKHYWTDIIDQRSQTREMKWVDTAYNGLHNLDCQHITFTSHKECDRLVTLQKKDITVHLAPISSYGRYIATVPDEQLSHGDLHDAVLVLDLYPEASFGHPVLVYFVNTSISRHQCQQNVGVYLEQEECMYLAVRRRCKNGVERRSRRRNMAKRCEINFLPTVHLDSDRSHTNNHLECRSDLSGFHTCPRLRELNETLRMPCYQTQDKQFVCPADQEKFGTSCRVFEICDQAVILSGGWNTQTTDISYTYNLVRMYALLRNNGFNKRNIKIFFANGLESVQTTDEMSQTVYSAVMKLAFRHHIQKMCSSLHCVDSLVLYFNSPALHDGSSLLWDVNQDGLADDSEKYTVKEFMSDLADCMAKQVHIIVDQSYSGEIVHAVKHSIHHTNLLVISNGKANDYSFKSEFSKHWTNYNGTRACTVDIFKDMSNAVMNSTPSIVNSGNIRTTISGAPCNIKPALSERELKRIYQGCQNLPTAVWLREFLRESTSKTVPG